MFVQASRPIIMHFIGPVALPILMTVEQIETYVLDHPGYPTLHQLWKMFAHWELHLAWFPILPIQHQHPWQTLQLWQDAMSLSLCYRWLWYLLQLSIPHFLSLLKVKFFYLCPLDRQRFLFLMTLYTSKERVCLHTEDTHLSLEWILGKAVLLHLQYCYLLFEIVWTFFAVLQIFPELLFLHSIWHSRNHCHPFLHSLCG